jgi:TPR repeat protein
MTIPAYQVVEVRGRRPGQDDEVGSGFLLSDRLVLTAAHVVFAESGAPHGVVLVRLGQESDEHFFKAVVAWPTQRALPDAALVEITDQSWHPPQPVQPPRWGRITGGAAEIPCDAVGFPRARRDATIGRDTNHLSGRINPFDQLREGRYSLSLHSRKPESLMLWKGVSGAALFSGALLIGVLISAPEGFDGGMLTAEPLFRLITDAAFTTVLAAHGIVPQLESAELEGLFVPPTLSSANQSRARMLDAALEVVPFRGREELLAELGSWCETGGDFSARLIIGTAGQGKTRLARELCHRRHRDGRVAGLVDDRVPGHVLRRLADTSEPVLLVVDLAEGRSEEISAIVDVARRRSPNAPPIRLLMLARSDGDWWDEIRLKTRGQLASAPTTVLRPLDDDQAGQLHAYHQALQAFAGRLAETEPDGGWQQILTNLARPDDVGRDDGDAGTWSALTLQIRALNAVLHEAGPVETENSLGERPEDDLLQYEEQFWSATAPPGRVRSKALRRAVAAAMLYGAVNATEARNLLSGLKDLHDASPDDRKALAGWIHGTYPVPSGRYWGYLQPDRVGEHLIRRVADAEPGFLDGAAKGASDGQRNHAMTVFARIGGRMQELGMLAEARKWYRRAAESGHNDAAFKLAELLCAHEPEEAGIWYEQAALSGHNDAAFKLGLLLEDGRTAEARKWYERAALSGHNDAAYYLGELLWKQGLPSEARKWFMRAAAAGHTYAAYQLGWLLRREEGDHAGATFWWRMAFEGGYKGAAFDLAGLLAQAGRPADAQHWYRQAAERGHDDAAYHLGELLWADNNPDEAKPWYEQAAEHGHAQAARQLGWLLLNTKGDRVGAARWWRRATQTGPVTPDIAAKLGEILVQDGAPAEAQDWYRQAAAAGDWNAAYQLGELLWADGCPQQAIPCYEQAAGQGHARAAFQLGWLHHVAGEHDRATHWWTRAAELGERQAAPKELGDQLWSQDDPGRARQWYERAARDGDTRAAFQLGWLLQVAGDRAGAIYWWENAARHGDPDSAFQLAELLWQENRPAEARQWYQQAANNGRADAAHQLGWLLKEQNDHTGAMD